MPSLCRTAAAPQGAKRTSAKGVTGAALVPIGLLLIKISTKIGTLCRKGRDPLQNFKHQKTFVTQDEEIYTTAAVKNVSAGQIVRRQPSVALSVIWTNG